MDIDPTGPRWLDHDEQRVWHAFQRMRTQFAAAIRNTMQADSGVPEAEYEVLAVLSDAAGHRLQARDLRLALQWEKSRLSHRIAHMQRAGLVTREASPDDPRAPIIAMTLAGRDYIAAAAPAHAERVRDLVFDALTPEQQQALEAISLAISQRLADRGLTEF